MLKYISTSVQRCKCLTDHGRMGKLVSAVNAAVCVRCQVDRAPKDRHISAKGPMDSDPIE